MPKENFDLKKIFKNVDPKHIDKLNEVFSDVKAMGQEKYDLYKPKIKAALNSTVIPVIESAAEKTKSTLNTAIDKLVDELKNSNFASNSEWLEKKYHDYMAQCKAKGQEIKSREEFKNIVENLKGFKDEAQSINLYHLFGQMKKDFKEVSRVTQGAADAGLNIVNSFIKDFNQKNTSKAEPAEKSESTNTQTETTESKVKPSREDFLNWVREKDVTLSDNMTKKFDDIYDNYFVYCESLDKKRFTKIAFLKFLKIQFPELKEKNVTSDNVEVKKVNLKFK